MTEVLADMEDIVEAHGLGEEDDAADLTATDEATGQPMEFHVQMRGYTFRDMEALIVEAAARQITGRTSDSKLSKEIEERCAALVREKADAVLERVTKEIIDQPVTPKWGDKKPVTMREMIGLCGREYLTEKVNNRGEPTTSSYDAYGTRMQWLVWQAMSRDFKNEISKATSAAISEIKAEMKAAHQAVLDEERARFRKALAEISN